MTAAADRSGGPSVLARAHASIDVLYREMAKFGAVGAIAFVVDFGVFNLMRTGIIGGEHGLAEKPLTAKTISVLAATVVAWLGNRYWTFRHRRRASARREFVLFAVMNVGGLAISLACLAFSHYVLGLTSTLADNVAGNVIGLGLGTLFRFWAYRQLVFTTADEQELLVGPNHEADLDQTSGAVTDEVEPATAPQVSALNGTNGTNGSAFGDDAPMVLDLRGAVRPADRSVEWPVPVPDDGSAQRRQP